MMMMMMMMLQLGSMLVTYLVVLLQFSMSEKSSVKDATNATSV
jgi:branched-subunit amino acid transport protein